MSKHKGSNMGDAMEAGLMIHGEDFERKWPVTFSVQWSHEDECYVATCDHYRLLSHLDADPLKALEGMMELYVQLEHARAQLAEAQGKLAKVQEWAQNGKDMNVFLTAHDALAILDAPASVEKQVEVAKQVMNRYKTALADPRMDDCNCVRGEQPCAGAAEGKHARSASSETSANVDQPRTREVTREVALHESGAPGRELYVTDANPVSNMTTKEGVLEWLKTRARWIPSRGGGVNFPPVYDEGACYRIAENERLRRAFDAIIDGHADYTWTGMQLFNALHAAIEDKGGVP